MTIHDKRGLLGRVAELPSPTLELGCGEVKKRPDAIAIDRRGSPAVDIVGDVFEVLAQIPDRVVGHVYSSHTREFHEESLSGLASCYSARYLLERTATDEETAGDPGVRPESS